jgi:glycosyltransferase involved in cell wall biosynthesis
MLKGKNIICLSPALWNDPWTRKQKFMSLLAEGGNRVLYVEPVPVWGQVFGKGKTFYRCERPYPHLKKISQGLWVARFTPFIPFKYKFFKLNLFSLFELNFLFAAFFVRRWQRQLGMHDAVLWVYEYQWVRFLKHLERRLLIYDCVDEHSEYPFMKGKAYVTQRETRLLAMADIVLVTAHGLLESKKRYNPHTYCVPNGVDFALFSREYSQEEIPREMRALARPIVLYAGALHPWLDVDLLRFAATKKPSWSFVLLGPDFMNLKAALADIKNIHCIGYKEQKDMPAYLAASSVCIIPFKMNKLTENVNPLKAYEYLAAGKPVVSMRMPELDTLEGKVHTASSHEAFVGALEYALAHDNEQARRERREVAKKFSWELLLEKASVIIQERI